MFNLIPLTRFYIFWAIIYSVLFISLQATIKNPERYFSPNLDGSKDLIKIPLIINERDLARWTLYILKKDGGRYKKVKIYESFNVKDKQVTFEEFFARLVERDEAVKAPEFIEWDGTDYRGRLVKDGTYYFSIEAVDRTKNRSSSPFIPIVIDTSTPEGDVTLEDDIFSPNYDEEKETLDFKLRLMKFNELDSWSVEIINQNGMIVKKFKNIDFESAEITNSQDLFWDGQSDDDSPAEEGFYHIQVTTTDLAGNKHKSTHREIELVRTYEKARLESSSAIISPNEDNFYDDTTLQLDLSRQKGLLNWKLDFYNDNGDIINTFSNEKFRKIVIFEGRGKNKKVLPDGRYGAKAQFFFRSGNKPMSNPIEIEIDNTSPKIKLDLKNKAFNPQAKTGGNRTVIIEQKIEADKRDQFQGVIINEAGEIVWQKDFQSEPDEKFEWDGKDDNGEVHQGKYIYSLTGTDLVGNSFTAESDPFEIITGDLQVRFIATNQSLSPNKDGFFDAIHFTTKINKNYRSKITGGKVEIISPFGKVIKAYTFTNEIPNVKWSGRNQKNISLPDGIYVYRAEFNFDTKESVKTQPGKIYLDTTPVQLSIVTANKVFSPNNDGNLDELVINNLYKTSDLKPKSDRFIVQLKRENGVVYQENEWEGRVPKKVIWRGLDQLRNPSPEGFYTYNIKTIDHAYNVKIYKSKKIKLVRTIEQLDFDLNDAYLSAHPEAKVQSITISPQVSSLTGLKKIYYTIADRQGNSLSLTKKFDKKEFSLSFDVLRNKLKKKIKQNEKNRIKQLLNLQSGEYDIHMKASFDSGNQPEAPPKSIVIDNEPPEVKALTRPKLFSPDKDGVNEELDIRITANDNYQLKKATAFIYRKVEFQKNTPFKQTFENYYKQQLPIKVWSYEINDSHFDQYIKWDGVGDLGNLVESATEYLLFVKTEDKVGIPTVSTHKFTVDILVEKLKDGRLRIIINNIYFKYNSDDMIGNYKRVLKLLTRMLKKFPNYRVVVEGHTDSRGSNKYNQELSLARALRVKSHLIRAGIEKKNLKAIGRGESQLRIKEEVVKDKSFTKNQREKMTEENYRKNRRVEFYLNKKVTGNKKSKIKSPAKKANTTKKISN